MDALKTALGWVCFHIWTRIPSAELKLETPFGLWLLSWAGYYAYGEGRR